MGTVADLLEVPRDLERAVEAALGERLQWVVVERLTTAKSALDLLRAGGQDGGGQATFLPLEWLNGGPKVHVPLDDAVVGEAGRLVGVAVPGAHREPVGYGGRRAVTSAQRSGCGAPTATGPLS